MGAWLYKRTVKAVGDWNRRRPIFYGCYSSVTLTARLPCRC